MAGPNIQSPGPATPMFDIIRDEEGKVQELRLTPEWSAFFSLLAQVQFSATRSGSTSARPSSEMLRWIGMQTYDTDEQSPAWLKQASTNTWIYPQIIGNDLILPNEKTYGIKLDEDNPDYGYRDILGEIRTRGVGSTDPADAVYVGNIRQYQFAVNDVAWINFHMPHDYVPGSDIFLHYHWSHTSGSVTGGTVTWGYEITFSKGFDQEAFVTPVSGTVVGTASATQYQHIVTEVQVSASAPSAAQLDSATLETDGVFMLRVILSANNMTGATPAPYLHFVDIHYQSTGVATKNKAPDFWT